MIYLCFAFALIAPYLICAVNPAIAVARLKSGVDIRKVGSGNPGLTNTLRTQGKVAALIVLLLDVSKGVVSLLLVRLVFHLSGIGLFGFAAWLSAITAVLGHCYPVYYGFKGGKAILVTVAVMFVIDWKSAALLLSLFIIIVLISGYVSLGSVIAASAMPSCVFVIGFYVNGDPYAAIGAAATAAIAALLVFKHKGNIKRLMNKTEKKLRWKNENRR